jgi:hypothetical protein
MFFLHCRFQLRQKLLGFTLARLPGHPEKSRCGPGGKTHIRVDYKISVLELWINA